MNVAQIENPEAGASPQEDKGAFGATPGGGAGGGGQAASLACVLDAAAGLTLSEASSSGSLDSHRISDGDLSQQGSEDGDDSMFVGADWRPSQADMAGSAARPVLLAAHPGLLYQRFQPGSDPRHLPVNNGTHIEFETPLFSGRACVWVRGAPGCEPGSPAAAAMFAGRRRRTLVTVQGRFRQPVPLDDLVTGQEFGRVENLPPSWLVDGVLLRVARAVSPSMEIGPTSAPSMLMPVAAGCAEMHAALPGGEPDPSGPPREDLRAWDASLTAADGSPLPAAQRKAFFSRGHNRQGRCFPTDLVFTFYFYQHVVDVSTYQLDVVYKFDLCRYLRGQPLQLMMRQRSSGQYLYCLHLWHERLLQECKKDSQKK